MRSRTGLPNGVLVILWCLACPAGASGGPFAEESSCGIKVKVLARESDVKYQYRGAEGWCEGRHYGQSNFFHLKMISMAEGEMKISPSASPAVEFRWSAPHHGQLLDRVHLHVGETHPYIFYSADRRNLSGAPSPLAGSSDQQLILWDTSRARATGFKDDLWKAVAWGWFLERGQETLIYLPLRARAAQGSPADPPPPILGDYELELEVGIDRLSKVCVKIRSYEDGRIVYGPRPEPGIYNKFRRLKLKIPRREIQDCGQCGIYRLDVTFTSGTAPATVSDSGECPTSRAATTKSFYFYHHHRGRSSVEGAP